MIWLITGGCGFVGANLADFLLGEGKEVVLFDNMNRVGSKNNLDWLRSRHGNSWRFIEGDIRNFDETNRLLKVTNPDVLAHLAGQVAMTTSIENPRLDFDVNALGTFNILDAVRLYSASTIVLYSSTNKVYGSLDHLSYVESDTRFTLPEFPNGFDEFLPLDGYSPYGCSKLAAEQYVRDFYRIYKIPTVVFRHSSMYGRRQFATYDQGWIGWYCAKSLEMKESDSPECTVSGNGKQVRDVLHADDLIQVYAKAVQNIGRTSGKTYNIGGGMENSLSLLELFQVLEEWTGNKMRYRLLDWRQGDQKVFVADNTKANDDMGWFPSIPKEDGLRRMAEWSSSIF